MAGHGFGNQNGGQRLGITEPISWSGPTEYDIIKTRELEKVIDEFGSYIFVCIRSNCFVQDY